jgi:hypothetical protein
VAAPAATAPPLSAVHAPSVVATTAGTATSAVCRLTVGSRPWAEVFLDDERIGVTPIVSRVVSCGDHRLVFRGASSDQGPGHTHVETVTLRPGQEVKRTIRLGGEGPTLADMALDGANPDAGACEVTLGSRPWSEVWIDGARIGVTPVVGRRIPCGPHDVTFRNTSLGFELRETLVARAGKPLRRIVKLGEPE